MKNNKRISIIFFALTFVFITVSMSNEQFFHWIFERHQNKWSWYIRPLFLVPFCYFAYKKNLAGISITIFALFTSMFWFDKPNIIDEQVVAFLQFEKDWLYGVWKFEKVLSVIVIPISLFALALAFWKRSIYKGLGVLVFISAGKVIWSVQNAGESGNSIVIPSIIGLLICLVLLLFGYRKLKK